jgi:hypothetical protein
MTGDHFTGNYINGPVVTGGEIETVSGGGTMSVGLPVPDLLAALAALRAEIADTRPPKTEVLLDNVDDLAGCVAAERAGEPVEAAVAVSHWRKIATTLRGGVGITADLAQIGQAVAQLFGAS